MPGPLHLVPTSPPRPPLRRRRCCWRRRWRRPARWRPRRWRWQTCRRLRRLRLPLAHPRGRAAAACLTAGPAPAGQQGRGWPTSPSAQAVRRARAHPPAGRRGLSSPAPARVSSVCAIQGVPRARASPCLQKVPRKGAKLRRHDRLTRAGQVSKAGSSTAWEGAHTYPSGRCVALQAPYRECRHACVAAAGAGVASVCCWRAPRCRQQQLARHP